MTGKLLQLLDRRGRVQVFGLVAASTLSALLELGGVTSIVPFMALASRPELLQGNRLYLWLGQPHPSKFLLGLGALCLILLTLSNGLSGLCNWLSVTFANQQQSRLSRHLLRRYLHQPYEWYLSQQVATLSHNLAQARALVLQGFLPMVQIFSRLVSVALLTVTLLYLHPLVTALALVGLICLYAWVYRICRQRILASYEREWTVNLQMSRTLVDPLADIKLVRLASAERDFEKAYSEQLNSLSQIQNQRYGYQQIPLLALQTLTYSALLGLVVALVYLYGGGARVVGEAALYGLVAYRLVPQVQQIFLQLSHLEQGQVILDKLYGEFLSPAWPLPLPEGELQLVQCWSLSNLTFAYAQNPPVLRDINLSIRRNQCIGLLGPSGQGKTTLVNLLVGLLQPQKGSMQVDGRTLEGGELRAFQARIGYVPQDIFLSDDSILANITMGDPNPNRERALEAARQACLDEFVLPLEGQYDTQIGQQGVRLSGGQRQRIGIARALYLNPQMLVLDEATSALDHGTEAEIMGAIRSLAGSRTIVLVAHRLSTLQYCDQIYRVEGGQVSEGGPGGPAAVPA